jgi:hypothetical protein
MRAKHLAIVAILAAASASGQTDLTRYGEACDGSAAAALDATHFIVGEDDHDVLRIYRLGEPKPVAPALDLTEFLGNQAKPGEEPEDADIEAAARIGGRIYWIGSHGAARYGKPRPTRRRFFATDIIEGADPPRVQPAGKPYMSCCRT